MNTPKILKSDILLINCPNWEPRWPNMGLGYISEICRQNQYSVSFLDLNRILLNSASIEEREYWQSYNWHIWWSRDLFEKWYQIFKIRIDEIIKKIIDSNNQLIGFSVTRQSWMLSVILAEDLKKNISDCTIIFGGYDCQFTDECYEKYKNKYIDYIFIDEAEETIIEFMKEYNKGNNQKIIEEIPGILSLINPQKYQKRNWVSDIDKLPFPKYLEFNFEDYPDKLSLMIMGSRCCSWAKCTICPDTNRGGFFRTRSAENIFNEIKYHYENNNIDDFVFGDAEINGKPEILDDLCGRIIDSGIKIKLGGQLRVNSEVEISTYEKMKKAGFNILLVGLESASPDIIKKMNKGFKIEDAVLMFKKMKAADLTVAINLIVGLPGETLQNFYETVDFIKSNRHIIDHVEELNTCMVYKKCKLGEKHKTFKVYNTEDEYAWFGKDGNTITERRRRLTILSNLIDEMKYDRGYKWKKYDSKIV